VDFSANLSIGTQVGQGIEVLARGPRTPSYKHHTNHLRNDIVRLGIGIIVGGLSHQQF